MQTVFIDAETFWSQTHSLSKMPATEYVMHPDTELISMACSIGSGPVDVQFGETAIRRQLGAIDWRDKLVVAHNMAGFDAMLLAWRLGVRPAMWGCTLSMARPLHAKTTGLSLAKLVRHYGIGVKNDAVLHSTRGKHLADFTPDELAAMKVYNADDNDQCRQLFHLLKPHYTIDELWHIDCNIRMLVEAEFELDTPLLETALSTERSNKHAALMKLAGMLRSADDVLPNDDAAVAEWVREQMASSAKFAKIIEARGYDVPMKRSKTNPEKFIPAIAKTDEEMEALVDHDDPVVAAAAAARLSTKSTQLESRIQLLQSTYAAVGKLPVPAHYCGADTTGRDSGWLYNMYNLPRILKRPRVGDALRNSVLAPEGKVVGVADLSGIELRVNHTLWQVRRSMELWKGKANADLYRGTASSYYHVPEDEVSGEQRQFAKVLELSAGFGIGPSKFRHTARIQGGLRLSLPEAEAGIKGWRALYPEIADRNGGGWSLCHEALHYIAEGSRRPIDPWGLCNTEKDAIRLPSGRLIRYPNLRCEMRARHREVDGELQTKTEATWVYDDMRREIYMYGGKVDENIVQALARDIIFPNAIEFWRLTGLRPKHKVYDELVYLLPPQEAPCLLEELQRIMRTPPKWWTPLVLWSEGGVSPTYGGAK